MVFDELIKIGKRFYKLPVFRQLSLMIGLAAGIALSLAVVLWSKNPSYQVLYSQLTSEQTNNVLNSLQEHHIRFKIDQKSGSIFVPSHEINDARVKLAGFDLLKENHHGFELLNKESGLGSSRFVESARYKHALEGELIKTITGLKHVKSARVHLAIPKETVFINDKQKPTASVFLDLLNSESLSKQQVLAIQQLVATSIPNLLSTDVSVIDQNGNLLSSFQSVDEFSNHHEQLNYIKELENTYQKNIINLLSPLLGQNNVKVGVHADVSDINKNQEELNNNIHKNMPLVKRLSVSVVLNNINKLDEKTGKFVSIPLQKKEIDNIENIVKAAVGFDSSRGDKINVMNIHFFTSVDKKYESLSTPLWKQSWIINFIKKLIFILLLLLLIFPFLYHLLKSFFNKKTLAKQGDFLPAGVTIPWNHGVERSRFYQENPRVKTATKKTIEFSDIEKIAEDDPSKIAQIIKYWIGDKT